MKRLTVHIIIFIVMFTVGFVVAQKPDAAKPHSFESSDGDTPTFPIQQDIVYKCPKHGKVYGSGIMWVNGAAFHREDVAEALTELLRARITEPVEDK